MSTIESSSSVTIPALDRLEASALRHAMGSDNPFRDSPIVIAGDLNGVINLLTSVRDLLYGPGEKTILCDEQQTNDPSERDAPCDDEGPIREPNARNDSSSPAIREPPRPYGRGFLSH